MGGEASPDADVAAAGVCGEPLWDQLDQLAICGLLWRRLVFALRNLQHATCTRRHATSDSNTQHTACNIRHATCDMQHTTCNVQRATCTRRHATCNIRRSTPRREAYAVQHASPQALACPAAAWLAADRDGEAALTVAMRVSHELGGTPSHYTPHPPRTHTHSRRPALTQMPNARSAHAVSPTQPHTPPPSTGAQSGAATVRNPIQSEGD